MAISSLLRPTALLSLTAVVLLTAFLTACGGDDDGDSDASSELVAALMSEGATEKEARCFVDELGDDAERLFGASEEDLSSEDREKVVAALTECAENPPGARAEGGSTEGMLLATLQ